MSEAATNGAALAQRIRDAAADAKPGHIEAAILAELRAAGGRRDSIGYHGPGTGRAIDRMVEKGWLVLVDGGNAWRVSEVAP